MKYKAITIDTNIFKRYQNRLETSILAQLVQFKEGSIQLVLSEIVVKELLKHLTDDNRKNIKALSQAISNTRDCHLFTESVAKTLESLSVDKYSPEQLAKKRLDKFLNNTRAIIIKANTISIDSIVNHYFEKKPPFEKEGKKKKEFPDALALLSLEQWAEENDKKILAVSVDDGWLKYGEQSNRIDVMNDISKALEMLQAHAKRARKIISKLLGELSEGKYTNISDKIKHNIEELMESRSPYVEIESIPSGGSYEADLDEIICKNFEFLKDQNGNFRFVVAGIEANKITVKIPLELEVKVFVSGEFYASSEYIHLSTTSETRDIEMDLSILITFEGDFKDSFSSLSAKDISIVEDRLTIDIGQVDPF